MGHRDRRFGIVAWCMLLISGATLLVYAEPVLAGEQPTEAQIIDALKSPPKTRGLGGLTRSLNDPKAAEDRRFIDGLRTRSTRSLTVEERQKVTEIAREKPSIDLEINFDYNSATVGPKAVPVLVALGRALSKDELKGTIFLINGHTDAKGSDEYNQDLSERRADAVKRLLVEQFDIPATNLIAVGYGKTMLKNSTDPFAGENRRVQIVNTGVNATAAR
jgi:outer membrane protein OmpA-like peptidoglycan-associated protein